MMSRLPIDPEEMAKRTDEDFIASNRMVGEGTPNYDALRLTEEVEESGLPEAYQ